MTLPIGIDVMNVCNVWQKNLMSTFIRQTSTRMRQYKITVLKHYVCQNNAANTFVIFVDIYYFNNDVA